MTDFSCDYLVIGNSAAGIAATEALLEERPGSSVLIVGNEPYPAYGRPLISYMLEGKATEESMRLRGPEFYEQPGLQALLGPQYEAVELKPAGHLVLLANGQSVSYGSCLLATGSIPFTPPIEGLADAGNVFTFLRLDDAKAAWDAALEAARIASEEDCRPSRAIVIGGGLIGLKAAEALAPHVDEVVVLELAPRILPAVLDAEGAGLLAELLKVRGLDCRPGVSAQRIIVEDGRACGAVLTTGEELPCDLIVAAVGVRPNSGLAVAAGAQQGRGLICGSDMQTSLPGVYAAGDVTQVQDILDGSLHPLALWPNAVQQGRAAGLFMARSPKAEPFIGSFAVNAVDFYDISLLTAGVINPPEDAGYESHITVDEDRYTKFVTKDDRLMGYILLNRPDNAGIYTALIKQSTPLSSLQRDMFSTEPLNLGFPEALRWERLHPLCPESLTYQERGERL